MNATEPESTADDYKWFQDLLVEHMPRLRAYAITLTYDRSRADDLVQQTMVQALRAKTQFQKGTNFTAWVYRILRNNFISSKRRSNRDPACMDDIPDSVFARSGEQENKLLSKEVLDIMDELPQVSKEVLMLICMGGYSYEEAAVALECSVGTIKSRLWRARRYMEAALKGEPMVEGHHTFTPLPPRPSLPRPVPVQQKVVPLFSEPRMIPMNALPPSIVQNLAKENPNFVFTPMFKLKFKPVCETGPRPVVAMLHKTQLKVNQAYQRTLETEKARRAVLYLIRNYTYAAAGITLVSEDENEPGTYWLLDGQHRWQAALHRDDLSEILCLIVDCKSLEEQVKAFLDLNKRRSALNSLQMFYAEVAAGTGGARELLEICKEADVEISRSPKAVNIIEPNETIALGTLQNVLKNHGKDVLVQTLRCIREAHPVTRGQLSQYLLLVISSLLKEGVSFDSLKEQLAKTTSQHLEAIAKARSVDSGRTNTEEMRLYLRGIIGFEAA